MSARRSGGGGSANDPIDSFENALERASPRPDEASNRDAKKNYAERLSQSIATLIANRLRATGHFDGIVPHADGTRQESGSASGATKKLKKTDVRFATIETGLELLVSIKTLNFRDSRKDSKTGELVLGRYTKNMVRNDHELRAEAMDHHERFPYAVLIALFFLPAEAADDAKNDKSSFAHAVMTFRPRTGRLEPADHPAKFERMFIGLYSHEPGGGRVGFFDVADAPPRRGCPPWPDEEPEAFRGGRLKSLDEVVEEIVREYGIRNRKYIRWADEGAEIAAQLTEEEDEADTGDVGGTEDN
jgi:hypothetical protein